MESYYGDIVRERISRGTKVFGAKFVKEMVESLEATIDELMEDKELGEKYMAKYCEETGDYIIGFND